MTKEEFKASLQLLDFHFEIISAKIFIKSLKASSISPYLMNFKNKKDKLYKQGDEIKESDFKRFLTLILKMRPSEVREILDALTMLGDPMGQWYELPIVKKAKAFGPLPYEKGDFLEPKQYLLINRLLYHSADKALYITTGLANTGKSTYLNIVRQLFDNDFSSATLSDLSNPFTLAEAVKHRLICSDELAKGELDCAVLKTLAAQEPIFCNPKGIQGYDMKSQSQLFWCCNKPPRIDATDPGIITRLVYYIRNNPIQNIDVTFKSRLYDDKELLRIARTALSFERDDWRKFFDYETHRKVEEVNTVFKYLNYIKEATPTYSSYTEYCRNRGYKPFNADNYEELYNLYNLWKEEDKELIKVNENDLIDWNNFF